MIYLIRHGQTALNRRQVLQGRSDAPLSEAGAQQVREAAAWFRARGIVFDRVFSSPLLRARQTAEILAPGAEILVDDRLIEMDYGPYEGMDLTAPAPEVLRFFSDFQNVPAPAGMEPLGDVVARLGEFFPARRAELSGDVLIATHAIAMKGALEYLTPGSDGSYWAKHIGNCAVYAAALTDEGFTVPEEVRA